MVPGYHLFHKVVCSLQESESIFPMRTWALELRAFAQLLLPHNGINFLSIRQTQIVFVVSEEGQEEVNFCKSKPAPSVNAKYYLSERRNQSSGRKEAELAVKSRI